MYIVDQIATAIEIFSAIVLFLELIFICFIRRKLIKSTFFQCFVFNGCYGLLSWVVSYQLLRSIGANSLPYLSVLMLLSGLSLHGYLLSSFLTSFNRFTAIVLPHAFDHAWKLQYVMLYFFTVIICSVLSVYFRIGVPIEAEWIEEREEYRWLGYPPHIHQTAVIVTLSICFFVSFSSLIMNMYSLVSWRKYREGTTSKTITAQRNLLYFSVISFLCSFLICLQQLSANLIKFQGNQDLANVIFDLYFPLSAFAIFVEPYAIIFFSSALRNEILMFFGRTKRREITIQSLQNGKTLASNHPSIHK